MLRDVVGTFLDSVTEREFDAPLMALLARKGFTDIHFIHGAYEFGKDIIAKKLNSETGKQRQYAIQSKAGDLNQGLWREVRPQLEESEYNTRAHPNFDENLPRVAVLVTTGRLKGAAAVDAQEFRGKIRSRGLADVEFWDRSDLLDWLCLDPGLGLSEGGSHALLQLVGVIRSGEVTEPVLERYTRRWLSASALAESPPLVPRAAIESAIIGNLLREVRRLDLASLIALHLVRAAWAHENVNALPAARPEPVRAALRLFVGYATELLDQVEPLLDNPKGLLEAIFDELALVTYPAFCCRVIEILGLLSVITSEDPSSSAVHDRSTAAVLNMMTNHPGASRPVSDQFAVSLLVPTIVGVRSDRGACLKYLSDVATWLLDRHDPEKAGLGLGSLDEPEETAAERLLGGPLEGSTVEMRQSSYVATVLMDLIWSLEARELYDSLRDNFSALRIVPSTTQADESKAGWRRGGDDVWPQPRVVYPALRAVELQHHRPVNPSLPAVDALLLASVCRSRHSVPAVAELIGAPP